jgi:hypothetical protein
MATPLISPSSPSLLSLLDPSIPLHAFTVLLSAFPSMGGVPTSVLQGQQHLQAALSTLTWHSSLTP